MLFPYFIIAQPNILFIFSDDHSHQAIGTYGHPLSEIANTPNLDRIANEGMVFNKCYVTNSICGPSRAVVLTGKYSHKNGFKTNGDKFDGSQVTFPKLMQQGGYETALIGKWHLGTVPTGFDHFEYMNTSGQQGNYYNPRFDRNGQNVTYTGYNSDIVSDLGMDWLTNIRNKNKPFMLMLQYKATHGTWEPPLENLNMFDNITMPEPLNLLDDYSYRGSAAALAVNNVSTDMTDRRLHLSTPTDLNAEQLIVWNAAYGPKNQAMLDANLTGDDLTRWNYQRYIKDYLRTSVSMDKNIGRVLDYLETNNLKNNTVVIYASDQGFYLGEHGYFDKRFMYEESFKTPLMVRWPGTVQPGSKNNALVSNLDFAETILDIAGVPIPSEMQGASLLPHFQGTAPTIWRESHYYQYYEYPGAHSVYRHYGVTTGRYKLIYFHDIDEWEFYDLQKDPNEMINQYYIAENDSVIQELKKELDRLRTDFEVTVDPPINGLPTVPIQKWTEPLPTEKRISSNTLFPFISITEQEGLFVISIETNINAPNSQISLHRVNGNTIKMFAQNGNHNSRWHSKAVQKGIYMIRYQMGQKIGWRKILVK